MSQSPSDSSSPRRTLRIVLMVAVALLAVAALVIGLIVAFPVASAPATTTRSASAQLAAAVAERPASGTPEHDALVESFTIDVEAAATTQQVTRAYQRSTVAIVNAALAELPPGYASETAEMSDADRLAAAETGYWAEVYSVMTFGEPPAELDEAQSAHQQKFEAALDGVLLSYLESGSNRDTGDYDEYGWDEYSAWGWSSDYDFFYSSDAKSFTAGDVLRSGADDEWDWDSAWSDGGWEYNGGEWGWIASS